MPKIPTAEPIVGTEVPTVKEYQIPGAVPGAFGEQVAKALGNVGQSISGVGDLVNQQVQQYAKVNNAKLETEFMLGLQDIMNNDRTKTIKIDGVDVEVPDGIGDRQGEHTKGSALEYEDRVAKLRDETLKKQSYGLYRAELTSRISTHYLTGRERTIKHESSEMRKFKIDTYDALSINLAESVRADPFTLPQAIEKLKQNGYDKMKMAGTPLIEAENETADYIAKAALNAGETILQAGGTIEDTDALLEAPGIKENIPKEKYIDITSSLDVMSKKLTVLKDWQLQQTHTQGAFELAQMVLKGGLTPEQVRKYQQGGKIDLMTAAIFDSVSAKVKLNFPAQTSFTKSDALIRLLDQAIAAKDNKGIMKVVQDATAAYGKGGPDGLGFYQYAYFIQEMEKKFNSGKPGEPSESLVKFNNATKGLRNFATFLIGPNPEYTDKMVNSLLNKVLNQNIDPVVAQKQVQRETVIEILPEVLTYPDTGKRRIDPTGAFKIFTNEGDILDEQFNKVKKENKETKENK